jgi:hypothetical protein
MRWGTQEKLPKDPDFDPRFSQLFDVTHVTDVQLTAEDVRALARATVFSPDSRRAILVDTDLKFGLARMFEVLRDTMGERGVRVFRNLDDAPSGFLPKTGRFENPPSVPTKGNQGQMTFGRIAL